MKKMSLLTIYSISIIISTIAFYGCSASIVSQHPVESNQNDNNISIIHNTSQNEASDLSSHILEQSDKSDVGAYSNKAEEYGLAIDFKYDIAGDFHEGLSAVQLDGQFGYINEKGEMVIENKFEIAGNFSEGLAAVMQRSYWYFIDVNGIIVFELPKDYALDLFKRLETTNMNKTARAIDSQSMFYNNCAILKRKNNAGNFTSYSILIRENDKFKIIDFEKEYAEMWRLENGLIIAKARYKDHIDFIDSSTGELVNHIYAGRLFGQGYMKLGSATGIDIEPNTILDYEYYLFEEGGASYSPEKWGYMDNRGNIIKTFESDRELITCNEGCIQYTRSLWGGVYGFVNIKTGSDSGFAFEDARDFNDGYAAVRVNGLWGYIDTDFTKVIEPQFDSALDFNDGLTGVEKRGYWGYIDKSGDFAIEPIYDKVRSFSNGAAIVEKQNSKYSIIDSAGNTIIESLDEVNLDSGLEGIIRVKLDSGWTYFDLSSKKMIYEPQFASVGLFHEGMARVSGSDPNTLTTRYGFVSIPSPDDLKILADKISIYDIGFNSIYNRHLNIILSLGMKKSEVEELLGEPFKKDYYVKSDPVMVRYTDGVVSNLMVSDIVNTKSNWKIKGELTLGSTKNDIANVFDDKNFSSMHRIDKNGDEVDGAAEPYSYVSFGTRPDSQNKDELIVVEFSLFLNS